jgi:serine-type D-Ala-D-Ala carboxypeptidase (penicillin-binding protein 5/6)
MNAAARRIGMSRSHSNTPNGWMDGGLTRVTARDLVRLANAMVTRHPKLYRHFSGRKRYVWQDIHMRSHDPTVGVVPGADGIKTGYTGEAGYTFLGSAERGGRRLVMVLAGTPSATERNTAARDLLEWGFAAWRDRMLYRKGAIVGAARVQGGALPRVTLVTDRDVAATMPAGSDDKISLSVHYRGPVVAPVAKGQAIGELEIRVGELPVGHAPLYAGADIPAAGWIDRLRNGIASFFS